MGFKSYEDQQRTIAAARLENQKRACLQEVYRTNATMVPCMANDKMILEVIEMYVGPDVVPTASLFEDAVALNPDIKFVRKPVARQQEGLIDKIMETLQATNNPHWGVAHNVQTERKRMSFWTIEQLRARLAEINEKQHLQQFSGSELRSQLADHRAAQQPVGRKVLAPEITREAIHAMRSSERKFFTDNDFMCCLLVPGGGVAS